MTDKALYEQRAEAAERVRVARTMAAARQDEESAKELKEALDAFAKLRGPQP